MEIHERIAALSQAQQSALLHFIQILEMQNNYATESVPEHICLVSVQAFTHNTGDGKVATVHCTAKLKYGEHEEVAVGTGVGSVDGIFHAIDTAVQRWKILGGTLELNDFYAQSCAPGSDAYGRVWVKLKNNGATVMCQNTGTNINFAAAKAIVQGINKLISGTV